MGNSDLSGDSTFHPFLWSRGTLQDLGTLGRDGGEALWFNDSGDVVGMANIPVPCAGCNGPGNQEYHVFLWSKGQMTDLGTVKGDECNVAFAINGECQVVGRLWDLPR